MNIPFTRFEVEYVDPINHETLRQAYERERARVEKELNGDPDALAFFDSCFFLGRDRENLDVRASRYDYDNLRGYANAVGC